jgi:hypothetical protein
VYAFFRRWRDNQLIRELHNRRRERVRKTEGRNTEPTASVIDSQSVKADTYGLAARRSLPTTNERAPATSDVAGALLLGVHLLGQLRLSCPWK